MFVLDRLVCEASGPRVRGQVGPRLTHTSGNHHFLSKDLTSNSRPDQFQGGPQCGRDETIRASLGGSREDFPEDVTTWLSPEGEWRWGQVAQVQPWSSQGHVLCQCPMHIRGCGQHYIMRDLGGQGRVAVFSSLSASQQGTWAAARAGDSEEAGTRPRGSPEGTERAGPRSPWGGTHSFASPTHLCLRVSCPHDISPPKATNRQLALVSFPGLPGCG